MMKNVFGDMLQQAQQMQEQFGKLQEQFAGIEVVGEAGAGMVKIRMSGQREVQRVEIDPLLLEEDKETLEDLIGAAINDAHRRLEQVAREKMMGFAGGNLPPGFKLPF